MKKTTNSFVFGAIALVFTVLGYQTALLVNYAATTRIIADRDCPDTVFVHVESDGRYSHAGHNYRKNDGGTTGTAGRSSNGKQRSLVRKERIRQKQIRQEIRQSVPAPQVESFRFDPNTASIEELLRLGFSPKQAASIDNYRRKGGRFRRKSDFKSSYAVSDSVFKRLEGYIDIPKLDLNEADSAAFDSLPGIGGYFARKMVEQRRRLGGYSFPEQLLDIRNFDSQRFEQLSDLITISHPYIYDLWALPADSLRKHPYIGDAATARSIVFFKDHNPKERWSVSRLIEAGVIPLDRGEKLRKCVEPQ